MTADQSEHGGGPAARYALSENVGYLLRRCFQISTSEFVRTAPRELSPPRFAALARLIEVETVSQNRLGRLISADAATVKGIVDRLRSIGAVEVEADPHDKRQRLVSITPRGRELYDRGVAASRASAASLMSHLSEGEARMLVELLAKASEGAGSADL
ncbi:MarR family winged helix-turn-helix transcriptional regulator [Microbacterium gubbeenense]|uniref:MarR family winged helix-turn-helix transcriptional regulator n=1 Tax=Microbacterium TaxID=33882 RepID=UPI003F97E051